MQLGELQNQIERFERRGASVVALSVDAPKESEALVERLGITFHLGSDRAQHVVRAYRVQNPDTQELALHAVYIMDEQGEIFYRKVARRRPLSNELIDAIDAYQGTYPREDVVKPRKRITVAYPDNNFQAILEVARVSQLPDNIDPDQFAQVRELARQLHSDDALIAYRSLMDDSINASQEQLLDTASWIARLSYFDAEHAALKTGALLRSRLDEVSRLDSAFAAARDADEKDQLLEQLGRARALLARTRAEVGGNADQWRLRLLKTSIRSYREVGRASFRNR